jgi:hypothetical protein
MRAWFGTDLGRVGLFALGVIALLAIGALALAGRGMISGADAQPAERAIQPTGTKEATPEPVAETAVETADETEPKSKAENPTPCRRKCRPLPLVPHRPPRLARRPLRTR